MYCLKVVNYPGNFTTAGIGQTGTVPTIAQTLLFWGGLHGGVVSFAGNPLAVTQTGSTSNYNIYAADISAYAGLTGELLFTTAMGGELRWTIFSFPLHPFPNPAPWPWLAWARCCSAAAAGKNETKLQYLAIVACLLGNQHTKPRARLYRPEWSGLRICMRGKLMYGIPLARKQQVFRLLLWINNSDDLHKCF